MLSPKNQVLSEKEYSIAQGGGCYSFLDQGVVDNDKPSSKGSLSVLNPRYAFALRRERPDGPWAIFELDESVDDGVSLNPNPRDRLDNWLYRPVGFACIFDPMRIEVGTPGCTIRGVSTQERDNERLVKVEFSYRSPKDKPRIPSAEGWVLYDSRQHWIIRELQASMVWDIEGEKPTASVNASLEYEPATDGFPIIKKVIERRLQPQKNYEGIMTAVFDLHEQNVPLDRFTLTAFGFPEPKWRWEVPWFLVAMGAGFICLLLGVWLWLKTTKSRNLKAS